MVRTYLPVGITVLIIVAATLVEARFSDRFRSTNVDAEEFGRRFDNVPMVVGPSGQWVGQAEDVSDEVLQVAGAVRHVNRVYTNEATGQSVGVWLIVGHSRDVCRHTPDICYPNQGFRPKGSSLTHSIELPNGEEATFLTCQFQNESNAGVGTTRVFWTWNANEEDKKQWEAPESQRLHFGNNRALYKLYFTTAAPESEDEISDSIVHREFAQLMLPEINKALFPEKYGAVSPPDESSSDAGDAEPNDETPAAL